MKRTKIPKVFSKLNSSIEFSSNETQNAHSSLGIGRFVDRSKPDINILCDNCKTYLNISELSTHMTYHNALQLYKFKDAPTSMEALLKRREQLIYRMDKLNISNDSYLKYVKTINEVFQILKRTIEAYIYGDNGYIYENREACHVQGFSFTPQNRLFLSVGMCSSQNKQFRADMEDTMKFVDCFGGNERFGYAGVFDGYNGKAASTGCREHLHDAVLFEMSKFFSELKVGEADETTVNRLYHRMIDPLGTTHRKITDINDAYQLAYSKMDYLLSRGLNETSPVRWSGTSALTAVIVARDQIDALVDNIDLEKDPIESIVLGDIHVANCGNVEALGVRAGEAFLMSQKHTLMNPKEKSRISETGILISENNLINGIIEKTRGLGNHGDKDLKKCLINSPYCWTYPIDANLECIVIATEGLWDVLRYDIVVDIVTQCLPSHNLPAPSRLDTALRSILNKYRNESTPSNSNENEELNQNVNEILLLVDDETPSIDEDDRFCDRSVQCSAREIQHEIWNALSEQQRTRLEVAQTIAERLVSAALLAESKSNISVMCLLLPGAAI